MSPPQSFADLSGEGKAAAGSAPSILDTTELRWFGEGTLPPAVWSWFTHAGTVGTVEERIDSYRLGDELDRGVKRRSRETLELKIRLAVEALLELETGLEGSLEVWRKWSPAERLVPPDAPHDSIDIGKTIVKRRFAIDGTERAVVDAAPPPQTSCCDAEIVAVTIGRSAAWSLAFAAYGPPECRSGAIGVCWRSLNAEAPAPPELFSGLGPPRGYPEWLRSVPRPADG